MTANRDRRAANSNVPRMYPNVPECTSNVPPNVPNGFELLKTLCFHMAANRDRRAANSNVLRVHPNVLRMHLEWTAEPETLLALLGAG